MKIEIATSPLVSQSHANESKGDACVAQIHHRQLQRQAGSKKKKPKKFDSSFTLRLLSIGMLNWAKDNSPYDFGSRKNRRVGDKK